MHLRDIIEKIPDLSIKDRKQLIHVLVESITVEPQKTQSTILDFAGIGEVLANGTDAQDHVNQLRSDWDNRQ